MAAISYDRYNVIVNGMSGNRMNTSDWKNSKFWLTILSDNFDFDSLLLVLKEKAIMVVLVCWICAGFWNATPVLGWGKYIPEGLGTECSFDYLTRDQAVA